MRVIIIDSRSGNSRSVQLALRALDIPSITTSKPSDILRAGALIFPGVGNIQSVKQQLEREGLLTALLDYIKQRRHLLAICVGAQLLLERSEECNTRGLGIFKGLSHLFPSTTGYKVPQMGWNQVRYRIGTPLFTAIPQDSPFYFVHSYYTDPYSRSEHIAWCNYQVRFPATFGKEGLFAVQFHPERSGRHGLQLLGNFVRLALQEYRRC